MAWNTPRDWATNEAVTSANMDTYVSENLSWLGTSRPHCQVRDATATAGGSAAWTAVSWDSLTTNVASMASSSTSYVTAPTAGFYMVGASAVFEGDTTAGIRAIMLSSSSAGGGTVYAQSNTTQHGGNPSGITVVTGVQLAAFGAVYLSIASSDATAGAVSNVRMWAIWCTT